MKRETFSKSIIISIVVIAAFFRFIALDKIPPALYSDELSQGYNAYSLLKTGKDEHGVFMPAALRAFGEWKPILGTYLMLPTMALFGLSEWGVRLPSAILGTLSVLLMYLFLHELLLVFSKNNESFVTNKTKIAYWGAFLLSISPWHIFQSRVALHGAVTLFFFLLALWSFLKGRQNPKYWYISSASFSLLPYSYIGMHLVVGLLVIIFGIIFIKDIQKNRSVFLKSMLLFLLLQLPLFVAFTKNPDSLLGRARFISVFYDQGVMLALWKDITSDGMGFPVYLAQFFHNKPWYFANIILKHVFEHLGGSYLFLKGEIEKPFQIPSMGIFYLVDALTVFTGGLFLVREKLRLAIFLFLMLIITLLPASLTFLTPSAHRSFLSILPVIILAAVGVTSLWKNRWIRMILSGAYVSCFAFFLFSYFILLPKEYASWWDYGEKELMQYLKSEEGNYEKIVISENLNMPYIALLFYQNIDPGITQTKLLRNREKDAAGFEHVQKFDRYQFATNISNSQISNTTLYVINAAERLPKSAYVLRFFTYPDWTLAYQVFTGN